MIALRRMAWVELKLFLREPLTVVFALVLPLIILVVMAGVFGNAPDPEYYGGHGPMDFYTPAYVGLVVAADRGGEHPRPIWPGTGSGGCCAASGPRRCRWG